MAKTNHSLSGKLITLNEREAVRIWFVVADFYNYQICFDVTPELDD